MKHMYMCKHFSKGLLALFRVMLCFMSLLYYLTDLLPILHRVAVNPSTPDIYIHYKMDVHFEYLIYLRFVAHNLGLESSNQMGSYFCANATNYVHMLYFSLLTK